MKRSEWVKRCAKRIVALTGDSWGLARAQAQSCADEQCEINGASGAAWTAPEEAADEMVEGAEE
ncbi:MAG: hypothetical protein GXY45_10535 [Ramlibacter sp.]|nr:hypothetical protein [Ramlibacter sp.]